MNRFFRPLLLAVLLIVLAAAGPSADAARTDLSPSRLTGRLLVASPSIGDPMFRHTVILILSHGSGGAVGIIINRPLTEHPLSWVLKAIGAPDADARGSVRLFLGGPVETQVGFILHSADYHRPETQPVTDRLALTSSAQILRDIGEGKGPKKVLVAFGYAGWTAGQLDTEMRRGDWATAEADPWLVFDASRDRVWDLAWARQTIDL